MPAIIAVVYRWNSDDLEEAIEALGSFLAMRQDGEESDEPMLPPKQVYSFDEDMVWIYSAFREAYGIDPQSVPYMHWWEFQTLFIGLPDNTEIKQRILYRNTDLRISRIRTSARE